MKMAKALVKFDGEKCKGCELCVSVCPVQIIQLHETAINTKGYRPAGVGDMEKCIGCANCAMICPDGVISVYKEEEKGGNVSQCPQSHQTAVPEWGSTGK